MTEEQVERRVEAMTDRLDARLMSGRLSQAEYDVEMKALSKWADQRTDRAAIWDRVRSR